MLAFVTLYRLFVRMFRLGTEFYKITAANFLFFIGFSFFILFPVFLKDIGASESFIGIMNGFDKISIIVTAFFIGSFIARRNRLIILRAGYIIMIIVTLLHLFIKEPVYLIGLIRIAHGAGFAISIILITTIIFETVPAERAAQAIGIFGITGALSGAISPLIGEALINNGYSFYLIFLIAAVSIGAALGLSFLLKIEPPSKKMPHDHTTEGMFRLLKQKKILKAALPAFIFGGGFGTIITFFPNFVLSTTSLGFSTFFIAYIGSLILVRFTLINSLSTDSRKRLMAAAFAAGAAMFFMMYILDNIVILIVTGAIYGFTHGVLFPLINTHMVETAGIANREKGNAIFTAMFNGGMMAFSASLGFVVEASASYYPAFFIVALFFLSAVIIVIRSE